MNKSFSKKSPLAMLTELALELWIKRQCKSINKIKLILYGSTLQLLSGKVSAVRLTANKVNFKDLPIENVKLESGPLQINYNFSKKSQKTSLAKAFEIKGEISFTSKALNQIVLSEQWNWIGHWLAKQLLDVSLLDSLSINNNLLELKGTQAGKPLVTVKKFSIEAGSGTLIFKDNAKNNSSLLPMDSSICIQKAFLKKDTLFISGNSKVEP